MNFASHPNVLPKPFDDGGNTTQQRTYLDLGVLISSHLAMSVGYIVMLERRRKSSTQSSCAKLAFSASPGRLHIAP